jgi:hypothetical protein
MFHGVGEIIVQIGLLYHITVEPAYRDMLRVKFDQDK